MIKISVENNIRSHENLIAIEKAKYSSEWLTFTEVSYGGFIFDLLAFNPKTKEIQITEVDISSPTPEAKRKFVERFATLRMIEIDETSNKTIRSKSFTPIAKIMASSPRMAILEYLLEKQRATYHEIAISIGLNPTKNAGRFAYHLKLLTKNELLMKEEGIYKITERGKRWLTFLREQ